MNINGRRRRTTVNVEAPEVQSIDDDFYDCMLSFLRGLKIDDKSEYTITYYKTQLTRFMYTLEDMRIKRSEEHTSELQSRGHLVCRLLLEKKKKNDIKHPHISVLN